MTQEKNTKITKFLVFPQKETFSKEIAQNLLFDFVIYNNLPFSIVENEQLRKFVSYGFKDEFKPVCRQTFKKMMGVNFAAKKEKLNHICAKT